MRTFPTSRQPTILFHVSSTGLSYNHHLTVPICQTKSPVRIADLRTNLLHDTSFMAEMATALSPTSATARHVPEAPIIWDSNALRQWKPCPDDIVIAVIGDDYEENRTFISRCCLSPLPLVLSAGGSSSFHPLPICVYTHWDLSLDRAIHMVHATALTTGDGLKRLLNNLRSLFSHWFLDGILLLRSNNHMSIAELTNPSMYILNEFYGPSVSERVMVATSRPPDYQLERLPDALAREQKSRFGNAIPGLSLILAAPAAYGASVLTWGLYRVKDEDRIKRQIARGLVRKVASALEKLGRPVGYSAKRQARLPWLDFDDPIFEHMGPLSTRTRMATLAHSMDYTPWKDFPGKIASATGYSSPLHRKAFEGQPASVDADIHMQMDNLKLGNSHAMDAQGGSDRSVAQSETASRTSNSSYNKNESASDSVPRQNFEAYVPEKKPRTRSIRGRKGGLFRLPPHCEDQLSDRDAESDSSAGDSGLSWDYALEEGHPLLVVEAAVTDAVLGAFRVRQKGTGNERDTEEKSAHNSFTPTVLTHIGQANGGKRKLAPCRKDGDESPSVESTQKKARTAPRRLTFACPFCKKDPLRYRTCYRYILTRIRDVKQHVARCHKLPIYCPSCMDIFTTSALRDEHARARTCPTRPVVVFDGVTDEQKQLLARRISSRHCEEDQWYTVFDILFPGHSRPSSPYIDQQLSEEMHVFRDFMASEGPRIMRQQLERHVGWLNSDADRDMDTFQDHILGQCLQRLFDEWERASTPDSSGDDTDSGTPPSAMASIPNLPEGIAPMESHVVSTADRQLGYLDAMRGSDTFSCVDFSVEGESEPLPSRPHQSDVSPALPGPVSEAEGLYTSQQQRTSEMLTHEADQSTWDSQFFNADTFEEDMETLRQLDTPATPLKPWRWL